MKKMIGKGIPSFDLHLFGIGSNKTDSIDRNLIKNWFLKKMKIFILIYCGQSQTQKVEVIQM
jgi:hypothetical protein